MKLPSMSNLKTRLALLIVLGMIPVLGLTLFTYLQEIRLVKSHIADDVERLTDFASVIEEDLIQGARQLVASLAKIPSIHEEAADSCDRQFAAILAENPRYANLGVVSPDGQLLCSAITVPESTEFSGSHWLRHAVAQNDISVEACLFPGVPDSPTLVFGCPVMDGESHLRGVVFAALDPEEIAHLALQLRLPASAELVVISCTGTILIHLPFAETWMGQTARDAVLVHTVLNRGKGITSLPGLDGTTRLYAFTPLSSTVETGLFVAIGIPESLALSEVNRVLLLHFMGLGCAILLALSVIWLGNRLLILRPVNALSSAVVKLSAGDMTARTGLPHGDDGELNRLAQSFDRMAATLETRTLQLRSLASQLALAEERERRRIATALHDRVAQTLAISRMRLGDLARSAASSALPQPIADHEEQGFNEKRTATASRDSAGELSESIEGIRQLIMQAIQDTRSLMFEISPPILYELGLEAALDWLAEQAQKRHGIPVTCENDGEPKPLDDDVRILLFQAAGELLTNVGKHSRALHAHLSIERDNEKVRVTVEDDGTGFDPSAIGPRRDTMEGFGLFSIHERLSHVGGRLDVVSRPGSGTRVILTVPLKNLDENGAPPI